MNRILLSTFLISLNIFDCHGATITWDGDAADGLWSTAANWVGNLAPLPGDNVILDNSVVSGNYTVTLPSGVVSVSVSSLMITPLPGNNITLLLPATNTAATAFIAIGAGDAVVLNNGAIFINASGATGGTPVTVTNTNFFRINNGGRYIHRTPRGHTDYLVSRLSTAPGTEKGIFEFDVPAASFTISLTGRTYGTLKLSSTSGGGTVTYSGNGGAALNINGDLQINSGVTFSVGLSANMFIRGNYIQSASSTFNMQNLANNNIVKVYGDIIATGTITESNSGLPVLELSGATNQNILVSGAVTNNVTLRINNPAGATLVAPLTLPYKIDLQNGKIKTDETNILTLTDNATVTGGSSTSFVEGPMKKIGDDNFTFPIGKGNIYAPAGFNSIGLAATDAFEAEYFRLNPQTAFGVNYQLPLVHHISYVEYWRLDKVAGNTNVPAKITLTVTQYSFAKDISTLFVSRYDNADMQWKSNTLDSKIPGVDSPPYVTGIVTSDAVSPFGIFTLATNEPETINPLPIKLLSFNAFKKDKYTSEITWQLAGYHSERVKFEVERSINSKKFSSIKTANGDISGCVYRVTDSQLLPGTKHYRLKMINEDGKINYSHVITIYDDPTEVMISLYPNPVSDKSVIVVNTVVARNLKFVIYDASGKTNRQWQQTINAGTTLLPLETTGLPGGVYFLSLDQGDAKMLTRFVKQ